MLYALGVGFCQADAIDEEELRFVFESDLKVVPTAATVIARDPSLLHRSGLDMRMMVHGEQRLTVHRPMPSAGEIAVTSRVTHCFDKGTGKGAVLLTETDVRLISGEPLCTLGSTFFARGDGGFGGPQGSGPAPHPIPDRTPDHRIELPTGQNQALLYRLCGDRNPLHADPRFARAAGFPRPILHGLATYGIMCRGVLKALCNYDPAQIKRFDVRFSAPIFPGETLVGELWRDAHIVSFRARIKERDAVVLNNGLCELTD
jgi:acyl dehydratase